MILKSMSYEDIFSDASRQETIKDKGHCYLEIKVLDKETGTIGVFEHDNQIDTVFMHRDECKELFLRRNNFKVELKKEGYYVIRYVDFHAHSAYSILDGMSTIDALADSIEYCGALTDHGNMFGFYKFYKAMKKRGKKPIIGFEAYINRYTEGDVQIDSKSRGHIVILCKDEVGYNNAIKLTTLGYLKGHKTKKTIRPAITYEDLFAHSEGLIVTSACMGGDIPKYIEQGNVEQAERIIVKMKEVFGDDFYIEIQRHGIKNEEKVNFNLIALARKHDIKIVAGVDSHYINKKDKHSQEVLLANNRKTTMSDPNRWIFPGDRYYKIASSEMEELFADIPEALDNTLEIADKCTYEIPKTEYHLPAFDIPEGFEDEYSYLESICRNGMNEKGFTGDTEYEDRLAFELDVIKRMGYSSYFLIVWDFIDYAKRNGILVGPGRGSACGSLVAYTMKITDVDPIRYGLLFERFLSPDRVSMPDKFLFELFNTIQIMLSSLLEIVGVKFLEMLGIPKALFTTT